MEAVIFWVPFAAPYMFNAGIFYSIYRFQWVTKGAAVLTHEYYLQDFQSFCKAKVYINIPTAVSFLCCYNFCAFEVLKCVIKY